MGYGLGADGDPEANTGVASVGGDRLPEILTNELGLVAVGVAATGDFALLMGAGGLRVFCEGDGDATGVLSFFFCFSELLPSPKVFIRNALNPDGPGFVDADTGEGLGPLVLA